MDKPTELRMTGNQPEARDTGLSASSCRPATIQALDEIIGENLRFLGISLLRLSREPMGEGWSLTLTDLIGLAMSVRDLGPESIGVGRAVELRKADIEAAEAVGDELGFATLADLFSHLVSEQRRRILESREAQPEGPAQQGRTE